MTKSQRRQIKMTDTKKTTIVKRQQIRHETSSGATPFETQEITYHIEVNPIKQYGHYEMYNDGTEYYAEGGLWFQEGRLVDYDGIFQLPQTISKQLIDWGFEVEGVHND